MKIWGLFILGLLWHSISYAHKASDSYLTITQDQQQLQVQWDIALRDIDFALGIDRNDDQTLTWGEVKAAEAALSAYAFSRLQLSSAGQPCPLQFNQLLIDRHSDGQYAVLQAHASCPAPIQQLSVGYQLLFDLDAQHRGLLSLHHQGLVDTAVFSPSQAQLTFQLAEARPWWQSLADYVKEGIWHIWEGVDHLLFLITLLLPATMRRHQKQWQRLPDSRAIFMEIFKIVLAFTLAHSLTLSLAVLGVVRLPMLPVEAAIAASVAIAAANNLYPLVAKHLVGMALGFGLIHGLGIASVLLELAIPPQQQALSLLGFNVGVEIGQLAVVGLCLPVLLTLSRSRWYPRLAIQGGSLGILGVALIWCVERSLAIQ